MRNDDIVGQRLPAEWEPQSGVLLTWPHEQSDWRLFLDRLEPVYVAIAREVALRQHLLVACHDEVHLERVRGALQAGGVAMRNVSLHRIPSNDTWARDHGPITVLRNGAPVILDFEFNAWGSKYAYDLDNLITRNLQGAGAFGETPVERVDLVLEGGSIETDGEGTLLTTAQCLLNPNRNPLCDREVIAHRLGQLLGVERILWLHHGHLAGDDTDSHIDTLARFCNPRTIAYVTCDDPEDEHYHDLKAMAEELRSFRAADGEAYRLVPLPMPKPHYKHGRERLPATYANFLIINGAVLVPTYNDEADAVALERLAACFPDREVVGIDCSPLIRQYGSLHCITMQLPAGVI